MCAAARRWPTRLRGQAVTASVRRAYPASAPPSPVWARLRAPAHPRWRPACPRTCRPWRARLAAAARRWGWRIRGWEGRRVRSASAVPTGGGRLAACPAGRRTACPQAWRRAATAARPRHTATDPRHSTEVHQAAHTAARRTALWAACPRRPAASNRARPRHTSYRPAAARRRAIRLRPALAAHPRPTTRAALHRTGSRSRRRVASLVRRPGACRRLRALAVARCRPEAIRRHPRVSAGLRHTSRAGGAGTEVRSDPCLLGRV